MKHEDIKTLPIFPNREDFFEFEQIHAKVRILNLQAGHFYRPFNNEICEVLTVRRRYDIRAVYVHCFLRLRTFPHLGISLHFVHNWDEVVNIYKLISHD
jgi:hypothetical protein